MIASRRPDIHGDRNRCPHARLELPAELLDETLLVLGELRIAFREHDLPLTRHQPQELHRSKNIGRSRRGGSGARSAAGTRQAKHVDGAGPGADVAQAVPHRLGRDPLRRACRLERLEPEREVRGQRRRVRAARAVRGARRDSISPAIRSTRSPSKKVVDGLPTAAVAAGHDDVARTEPMDRASELRRVIRPRRLRRPRRAPAPRRGSA